MIIVGGRGWDASSDEGPWVGLQPRVDIDDGTYRAGSFVKSGTIRPSATQATVLAPGQVMDFGEASDVPAAGSLEMSRDLGEPGLNDRDAVVGFRATVYVLKFGVAKSLIGPPDFWRLVGENLENVSAVGDFVVGRSIKNGCFSDAEKTVVLASGGVSGRVSTTGTTLKVSLELDPEVTGTPWSHTRAAGVFCLTMWVVSGVLAVLGVVMVVWSLWEWRKGVAFNRLQERLSRDGALERIFGS
jgi:hypothetical protein